MMCERALSRETQGSLLGDKQFVQGYIADSYAQLVQFRLFVLYTAWTIDKHNDYRRVRKDIAAVKVVMPSVLHDIARRAIQVHGALGVSNEMPFARMLMGASVMGLADGPTEVHKVTVARQVLRDYSASDDLWPTEHLPKQAARRRRPSSPSTSSTKWGTSDVRHSVPTLDPNASTGSWRGWTPRGCRARASRSSAASSRAAPRTRSTRSAAATCTAAMRIPPPTAPEDRDTGIVREWRIIEALDGTDVPHTEAIAVCDDPSVLGPDLLPHGLRRRLVPDGPARRAVAGAVRHRPRGPAGPGLRAGRRHRPALQGRLAGPRPRGPRAPRRLPRAPGRPVDGLPRADQGPGAPRLRRGLRLAPGPPAPRLHPRPHARRLPVRQRHVPARRTGPAGRHRRLGDGHGRRPEARSGLGRAEPGPRTPRRATAPSAATST